jgi:cell wall-associated NlpC family hydrolase
LLPRVSKIVTTVLLVVTLGGCGWMPWHDSEPETHPGVPGYVALGDAAAVRAALLEQHRQWRGVPYRMGGTDRNGLDCSGFTQLTFRQRFGVALPRDTSAQRAAGREVGERRIVPGDLLFFDTGIFERHVGIYLGERQFLHVSTRAGVMISSLGDKYWSRRFSRAVRVH